MTDTSPAEELQAPDGVGDESQAPEPSPLTEDTEAVAGERARDASGRFTRTGEAEADPIDDTLDPAPPSGEGEVEALVPPVPVDTPQAAEAATSVLPELSTPFAVRFSGRDFTVPDAGMTVDGHLVVKPEGVERISKAYGQAIKYEQEFPKLRSEIQRLTRERAESEEYNAAVAEQFAALAQLSDDDLVQAIQEFRSQYPALREKVRADQLERQLRDRDAESRPDPAAQHQQRIEAFTHTFDEVWDEAIRGQEALSAEEQKALREELMEIRDSFVVVAPQDNPDEGIVKGEWLFHEPRMKGLIARRVKQVGDLKADARKIAEAQKRNAAVLSPTPPNAPPLSASPKPPTPRPTQAAPSVSSRDAWEKKMERLAGL